MRTNLLLIFLSVFLLNACDQHSAKKPASVYTVKNSAISHNLFYSGIIQPLKATVVQSKTEGVVITMAKQYGQFVHQHDLLFTISSSKFLNDYKTALLQYIKAKNELHQTENQLNEATFLHKNQLISNDEFKLKQSAYYSNQLGFLQAKDALTVFMKQLNIKDETILNLSIADIDKVKDAMHLSTHSDTIAMRSPLDGIMLAPYKSEDENKKIRPGETCKEGEVLAVIGDLSGISIRIKVNEFAINQLALGQKVKITGVAFPGETLLGEISHLDHQGEGALSGQPTFQVEVKVKQLSAKQQKQIHVGMSANVEIELPTEASLMVPISAVTEEKGLLYVKRTDLITKKIVKTLVKTGKSNLNQVTVLSGLKEGDHVVLPS